jgi:hypothetical protein
MLGKCDTYGIDLIGVSNQDLGHKGLKNDWQGHKMMSKA